MPIVDRRQSHVGCVGAQDRIRPLVSKVCLASLMVFSFSWTSCIREPHPDISVIQDLRVRDLCQELYPSSPVRVECLAAEFADCKSREAFAYYGERVSYWARENPQYAEELVMAAKVFPLEERIYLLASLLSVTDTKIKLIGWDLLNGAGKTLPNRQVTDVVMRYTRDKSELIRAIACEWLAGLCAQGGGPGASPKYCFEEDWGLVLLRLVELSQDPCPEVRMNAINGLGQAGRVGVPFLVEHLTDRGIACIVPFTLCGTWEIRTKAAFLLGEIESPRSLAAVQPHLVRSECLQTLLQGEAKHTLSTTSEADLIFDLMCAYSAAKLGDFQALKQVALLNVRPVVTDLYERTNLSDIWTAEKLHARAASTPEDQEVVQELVHLLHDTAPKREAIDLRDLRRFVETAPLGGNITPTL